MRVWTYYLFPVELGVLGRTDVEPETPILWPPDAKSWLIWKDPDAGKDWGREEKGTTEDEMVGWHQQLNGHEFEWTAGVGDGQGGLVCCGSWGCKESDTTEWLNWIELSSEQIALETMDHFFVGENSLQKETFKIVILKRKTQPTCLLCLL